MGNRKKIAANFAKEHESKTNCDLRFFVLVRWPVKRVEASNQIIRETSFRKKPSNRSTNPPRNSLGIHDLLWPLATRETHSAINHKNKASLRITIADYIAANIRRRCLLPPSQAQRAPLLRESLHSGSLTGGCYKQKFSHSRFACGTRFSVTSLRYYICSNVIKQSKSDADAMRRGFCIGA